MNARKVTREEQRVREALSAAWRKGYDAGWKDCQADVTDDDGEPHHGETRNPYEAPEGSGQTTR